MKSRSEPSTEGVMRARGCRNLCRRAHVHLTGPVLLEGELAASANDVVRATGAGALAVLTSPSEGQVDWSVRSASLVALVTTVMEVPFPGAEDATRADSAFSLTE